MRGRVLIAAGSDSSGGAGVQADIKTVTALGGYAMTAITAVTVQNTLGVTGIHPISPAVIEAQMLSALSDIGADAIKTGMLPDAAAVEAVARVLGETAAPLIVDPVLVATSGDRLADGGAATAIIALLLPRAAIVTPNAKEAAALTGLAVESADDMRRAGEALLGLGAEAALITGGDRPGKIIADVLVTKDGAKIFEAERIETRHTHGTGCTLAAAIATGLAQGLDLDAAVSRARAYVRRAIAAALGLGAGHGPIHHGHAIPPYEW